MYLRIFNCYCGAKNRFDVNETYFEQFSHSRILQLSIAMNIDKVKTSEGKKTAHEIIKI